MSAEYEYAKSKGLGDSEATLVSLKNKKTKKSKKSELAVQSAPMDEYPYGLRIDLNTDTMKKLGIKKLPEVGAKFDIVAEAKVTRVSEDSSDYDGGKKNRSLCLQITKMALE